LLAHPQGEPQVLLDKAERLNNQLERLVMDNYHVFIQNITCSSIVSDQVSFCPRSWRSFRFA
jgi:hypothetical protein